MAHNTNGQLRLNMFDEDVQSRERDYSWLWFAVIIVLQAVTLAITQSDKAGLRKELDEHAVLIRQLQQRRIGDELIGIKRGK